MLVRNGIPNNITSNCNITANNEENICSLLLKSVDDERVDVLRLEIEFSRASKSDMLQWRDGTASRSRSKNIQNVRKHDLVANNKFIDSVDSVRALLSAGVNPCVQNNSNNTAYRLASSEEVKNAFVQELLQAVAQSNLGRVCQMISAGVSVDSIDAVNTGNTALHWGASYGNEDVVRILCQSGANVNTLNTKNETALHDAVRRGNEAVVKCLLSYGADPSIKNKSGEDCYELAAKMGGTMLPSLSLNTLNRKIRRTTSIESEIDRSSLMSTDTTIFVEKTSNYSAGRLENWTDLLWPQPKYIDLDERDRTCPYPKDGRLKIYFDKASEAEPRRLMQIIQMSAPILSTVHLELDYRGHGVREQSSLDGRITCGIFENGYCSGAYTLTIDEDGIEIYGEDHTGVRHGFSTLVQILRIFKEGSEVVNSNTETSLVTLHETLPESTAKITSTVNNEQPKKIGAIPCLTIRDSPDSCFRAVYQDFSGCKILNTETLLQLATRIGYCKASHLFVNFEVRTTDRYQLPYTTRDLFQITQVCDELFIKFVPSLDVQSSYIESDLAWRTIDSFLDDFPLTKVVHFGPNLAIMVISNRTVLNNVQRRIPRIYISVDIDKNNASLINHLPPFVTICVEGKYPFEAENLLSPRLNVVLRFSTSDPGFLCAAPESVAKKALLATRLGNKFPILGTMVCDLSTGCEVMPPSLSYMSELASLGVCWNKSVDVKRFCFLLPRITAEHFLLDGNMEALFKQMSTVGRVEHEITRYSYGLKVAESAEEVQEQSSSPSSNKKRPISVFVEMILNPDNMVLERLTPVIFKKARIELKRSLKILDRAKKHLPYNYELALVLAEIQIITELMVLTCKLGQSLCTYGINPSLSPKDQKYSFSSSDRLLQETTLVGYEMVNIGVSNLPPVVRTDLANRLLEIRSRFQHTWLSRNIASTLPNALKIFDNLFRALLPPNMQDYGRNLL
uniref:ANK_REP_REGION domain-containing protein n=1 Tax=Wuchereria bancrofti TaxID=6293 RepID=A0A1I8EYT1_WUCBA